MLKNKAAGQGENMIIRKAAGEEMLKLWGYEDVNQASPTAVFFYEYISSGKAVFWTIENDGGLIGELYAFLEIEEYSDFADGRTAAYLCAFRIRKDYRHQGLGTRLMETVLSDLKARGFLKAQIGVSDERNRRLYTRLGFTETVRICHTDPCARDENMRPQRDEEGYLLLAKKL